MFVDLQFITLFTLEARPMIIFDTFRRYLEYKGYDVNYVSNFTDVDDKIIKKAIEEGTTAEEIHRDILKSARKICMI